LPTDATFAGCLRFHPEDIGAAAVDALATLLSGGQVPAEVVTSPGFEVVSPAEAGAGTSASSDCLEPGVYEEILDVASRPEGIAEMATSDRDRIASALESLALTDEAAQNSELLFVDARRSGEGGPFNGIASGQVAFPVCE